jgi:tetratricopeptide (TPR) repeat protein
MTADISKATCPTCGTELPEPGAPCPRCTSSFVTWGRSRTVFLSLCGLLLIPMFAVTGVVVRLFHEKQASIAEDWRAAGEVNLRAGHPEVAIEDFRNALLYSPESMQLQLELAQALVEQGQLDEAQSYLFNLRGVDPENSLINLELARVAVRRGNVDAATSYFHDAMYGHWFSNAHENRLASRKELIEFFLKNNRHDAARAESLSMAADNPADPDIRAQAADYLLQAGDAQSALAEYQRVLRMEPNNAAALEGSGKAALELGSFSEAERYFTRAIQRGSTDPELEFNRSLSQEAADLDPFNSRLRDQERRKRILRLFAAGEKRAKACFPSIFAGAGATAPDRLKSLATARAGLPKQLSSSGLAAHPDWEHQALNWTFDVEKAAAEQCGPGTVTDRAIILIAGQHKET